MSEEKNKDYYEWLQEWEDLYFDCPRAAFKCLVEDLWQAERRIRDIGERKMKKRFLLIAGEDYSPSISNAEGAWVGFFDTREEAENCVEYSTETRYRITLPSGHYTIVNWHRIIDIEDWEGKRFDHYHIWYEPDETSDWYDCAHCEAGYPDQECTCEGFIKGEE